MLSRAVGYVIIAGSMLYKVPQVSSWRTLSDWNMPTINGSGVGAACTRKLWVRIAAAWVLGSHTGGAHL